MKYILVASGNKEAANTIQACFASGYKLETVADRAVCYEMAQKRRYELIFIDINILKGGFGENGYNDYKKSLQPFWEAFPSVEIIVLSSQDMIREVVNVVKAGASNYLTYPINQEELKYVLESINELKKIQSELDYFRDEFWQKDFLDMLRTNNKVMKKVFDKIKMVASTKTTVLLTGETGTGKGLLAKVIHHHSNRNKNQFISVHCGAIQDTLIESELFGHEKGAFTNAIRRKFGKFEIANKGTIFLDEIGTLSSSAQISLLQVLQEKTFQRVGGEEVIESDVRVIAATNIDLKKMCDEGGFRKDLYYRLNVFPVEIPPLRERNEDIPLLVDTFLKRLNKLHLKSINSIHPQVLEALEHYCWPGNIRELENLIERAYILEKSSMLTPESFPAELFDYEHTLAKVSLDTSLTLAEVRHRGIENVERHYLKQLLELNTGCIKDTARDAGITTRQLHKLLTKYGIRKEEFK